MPIVESGPIPERTVKRVKFDLLSAGEIVGMSCVEIVNRSIRAKPRKTGSSIIYTSPGSLGDPRMGSADSPCATCGTVDCLGHFGHIVLAEPIPHPAYLASIRSVLAVICSVCSTFIPKKDVCPRCLKEHERSVKRSRVTVRMLDDVSMPVFCINGVPLDYHMVHQMLAAVDRVNEPGMISVAAPERMIMQVIPVSP
ncbi:MAG: hypothetical protein EBS90_12070, partial [Betaproteobacteria bacterium]|nr:hypothetical protein [Betaproteobacteria bacterium]